MSGSAQPCIGFIGGGNMASAIIGGLRSAGWPGAHIHVVEPHAETRERLRQVHGVQVGEVPGSLLDACEAIVWAVKPQQFGAAAREAAPWVRGALQVSIAAGIREADIAQWTGTPRVVRAMPNTPALIGMGMTGLHRAPGASVGDGELAERLLSAAGRVLWVEREDDLDAVTALSGSGPAYVFSFLEALIEGGVRQGLTPVQARLLAVQTFVGASHMAQETDEPVEALRARVTSPGGTTYAALQSMAAAGVGAAITEAVAAARRRAVELQRPAPGR